MKLLFNQNISHRVIRKIHTSFPEAKQIRELGLEDFSDIEIWEYAKQNDFTIVTFDADFFELSNLFGIPPKIIWLRTGNIATATLAEFLIQRSDIIVEFIENPRYHSVSCLELGSLEN